MEDIKKSIHEEAGKIVNGERRKAYGKPEDNFARIALFWQAYFENTGRGEVGITAADVSPLMRLMKEARLCESPDHRDSFVDIIGYALTGAEINLTPKPDPLAPWWKDIVESDKAGEAIEEILDGLNEDLKRPPRDLIPMEEAITTGTDAMAYLEKKAHAERLPNSPERKPDNPRVLRAYNPSGRPLLGLYGDEWEVMRAISMGAELPFAGSKLNAILDYLGDTGHIGCSLETGYYLTEKAELAFKTYRNWKAYPNDDGKLSR